MYEYRRRLWSGWLYQKGTGLQYLYLVDGAGQGWKMALWKNWEAVFCRQLGCLGLDDRFFNVSFGSQWLQARERS